MKYRVLGNGGVRSSLGTMTFGEDWGAMPTASSLSKANKTMTRALAYGGMRDSVIA